MAPELTKLTMEQQMEVHEGAWRWDNLKYETVAQRVLSASPDNTREDSMKFQVIVGYRGWTPNEEALDEWRALRYIRPQKRNDGYENDVDRIVTLIRWQSDNIPNDRERLNPMPLRHALIEIARAYDQAEHKKVRDALVQANRAKLNASAVAPEARQGDPHYYHNYLNGGDIEGSSSSRPGSAHGSVEESMGRRAMGAQLTGRQRARYADL